LGKEPQNAEAMIGLSRAFRMNTEWEDAEVLLNEVVKLYPDMVEARTERGRFYWGRGFLLQALADYDAAKKLAGNDYWITLDRGSLLLEMNRRSQALEEFNRAIEINPAEYRAYAYSAGLKDDLGDTDGAERDYAILARLKPDYYFALEGLGLHKMKNGKWAEARDAFMEAYRQAPNEHFYGLLAAINQMRAENPASPRVFLGQVQTKVTRDTLLWYMVRLFYDLTSRNYLGENDMITRLDRTTDQTLKARMMFYMAQYYDVRGSVGTANMYYQLVGETKVQTIPEWRLNEWILTDRGLKIN
jgi:tetratricopeptide (TPR) repeat protein